uniref:Uncharacterized protein n=1 Tax=uncultured marine virus TaxID=186617 RepID=A0A0F7L3B3_9VIRU|nr:hypothetical protein [uncultured marine virus]
MYALVAILRSDPAVVAARFNGTRRSVAFCLASSNAGTFAANSESSFSFSSPASVKRTALVSFTVTVRMLPLSLPSSSRTGSSFCVRRSTGFACPSKRTTGLGASGSP